MYGLNDDIINNLNENFSKEFDGTNIIKEEIINTLEILSEEELLYFLEIIKYTTRT